LWIELLLSNAAKAQRWFPRNEGSAVAWVLAVLSRSAEEEKTSKALLVISEARKDLGA
jgi:hypothetical protein